MTDIDYKENQAALIFEKHLKKIIYAMVILIHIIVLFSISFNSVKEKMEKKDPTIFKIVNIKEYIEHEDNNKNVVDVARQDKFIEDVIETDKEINELDIDYLPQYKISEPPVIPYEMIKSKIVYPLLAKKQGIEGIVYLELYIDQKGNIRNIKILKDPGYGFGDAAANALKGLRCIPGKSNGITSAVMFRYTIRFNLL